MEKRGHDFLNASQYCRMCHYLADQAEFIGSDERFECPRCGAKGEDLCEASSALTVSDLCESCGRQLKGNTHSSKFCTECDEEYLRLLEEDADAEAYKAELLEIINALP